MTGPAPSVVARLRAIQNRIPDPHLQHELAVAIGQLERSLGCQLLTRGDVNRIIARRLRRAGRAT